MTTITFDSYKIVNILTEKGFTKEQAEGILEAVKEADVSHLATKQDLLLGLNSLKAEIFKFVITVAGVQTAIIGLIIAAVKLI